MIEAYGCIDIIIRRDALDKKSKGLSQKFIEEYKVELPHYDEDIICIRGGMNPYDAKMEVDKLEKDYGLIFNPNPKESPETDIVIIEGLLGIRTQNKWLQHKREKTDKGYFKLLYFSNK